MADLTFGAWGNLTKKLRDMGDGTHAEVLAADIGATTPVVTSVTVTAGAAYAAGNVIGGLMTIAGAARAAGKGGFIQSTVLNCKSNQTGAVDIIYFNSNPTGSTFTDKTAVAIAAADFDKVLGVAHITDWTSLGTPSVGQAQQQAMPYRPASGTTLYAVAVARSTPTYASTTDVSVTHRFAQD